MKKILVVAGTRPEVIKVAPILLCKGNSKIEFLFCITGQHKAMVEQALEIFPVNVDYNLDIMKSNQTLNDICSSIFTTLPIIYKKN